MKVYVELSVFGSRFNQRTGDLYYYLVEANQWVELGNIYQEENGHYVNVYA